MTLDYSNPFGATPPCLWLGIWTVRGAPMEIDDHWPVRWGRHVCGPGHDDADRPARRGDDV